MTKQYHRGALLLRAVWLAAMQQEFEAAGASRISLHCDAWWRVKADLLPPLPLDLAQCPVCARSLDFSRNSIVCRNPVCASQPGFPCISGRPVLIDFARSVIDRDALLATEGTTTVLRHRRVGIVAAAAANWAGLQPQVELPDAPPKPTTILHAERLTHLFRLLTNGAITCRIIGAVGPFAKAFCHGGPPDAPELQLN